MENRTRYAVDVTGGGRSSANGTTPCKTNCPCTSAADMERRQGVGAGAGHPQCRTVVADCMAEYRREHRGVIRTPPRQPKDRPRTGRRRLARCYICALAFMVRSRSFSTILSSVKPSGFAVRPARLCGDYSKRRCGPRLLGGFCVSRTCFSQKVARHYRRESHRASRQPA